MGVCFLNKEKTTVTAAYFNNSPLSRVYRGNELIWEFKKEPANYTILNYFTISPNLYKYNFYLMTGEPSESDKALTRYDAKGQKAYGFRYNDYGINSFGIISKAEQFYFPEDMHGMNFIFNQANLDAFRYVVNNEQAYLFTDDVQNCFKYVKNAYMLTNGAKNLTGTPKVGPCTIDISWAYASTNISGEIPSMPSVEDMSYAYYFCKGVLNSPKSGPSVINMAHAYDVCNRLTGSPECGSLVVNLSGTYRYCYNITGSPKCGVSVEDMSQAYFRCYNLTGDGVSNSSVTNMDEAYRECNKLDGTGYLGQSVTTALRAYYNCRNLQHAGNIPESLEIGAYCFSGCNKLGGSIYFPNVTHSVNAYSMFGGRSKTSQALYLYVPEKSAWYSELLNVYTAFNDANNKNYITNMNMYLYTY